MKKKNIIIIGIILTLIVAWGIQSLREFYASGQSQTVWFYFKSISKNKLIDFAISLIPVIFTVFYYAFKQHKKNAQT